jgi:hypothetical protein
LRYVEQLGALIPRARDVTAGLSASQLNGHPVEGSWSVAECIAHLNTTNTLYISAFEKSFNDARQQAWLGNPAEPRLGFLERWFANRLEPPYTIRVKTPRKLAPQPVHYDRDELLARWVSIHERLIALATENADLDWKKTKICSPVSDRIKFSPLGAFAIIGAHDRRHLWQAERIRAKLQG